MRPHSRGGALRPEAEVRASVRFPGAGAQPVDEETDHNKTDGQHCPELWIVEFFAHGLFRLEKVTVLDTENFL